MTDLKELQKQLDDIREELQTLLPGSRAYQRLSEEQASLEAQLTGSGAAAQGDGATAIGEDGIGVGGNLDGTLIKGEQNQVFRNSTVILAGDGAHILVGEHSTEHNSKPNPQAAASYALTSTDILTFLFTDIEGSTQLWEQHPEAMKAALARHDAIMHAAIESHKGKVFKTVGDAFYTVFPNARNALKAALAAQRALHAEVWGETVIKVRMALHTGTVEMRDNDYFGPPLNRVARLMSAGHGGQILLSAVTRALLSTNLPTGVELRDMGERGLKDLIRPEHIYQLNAEGLPTEFPPLKTLDAFRTNLPLQLTSFVGREKEIVIVKELVARNRLTTLIGPGGGGKTRLSLQVAADLLESFPDGVWFVELAHLTDPALVSQTVATALGLREEAGRSLVDTLTNYLRAKSVLLLLNNCEHLVETVAQITETLLQACPNLRLLVSSREALGSRGETAFRVPSLSIPDTHVMHSVETVMQSESAQLFVERAQTVLPSFTVTKENAPALAQVCARLDGIPLAIELAAARVKMLKVEQIAQRLDDRFRLLTGGSRTALPRHQTLRALIDWSYELLPDQERALLRRLSVFSGGWTLEAAETVCQGQGILDYDVLEPLTQLINKSLVAVDVGDGVEMRYRLLETVRQYAREKLTEAGEGIAVRDRHLEYFLGLAERAEQELVGPRITEWIKYIEAELDNIRAAVEWSVKRDPQIGLRLVSAIYEFLAELGYIHDTHKWLTYFLNQSKNQTRNLVRAKALINRSNLEISLARSRVDVEEALLICRELGDQSMIARGLSSLGNILFHEDHQLDGVNLVVESLTIYRAQGDKVGIVDTLCRLGAIEDRQDYQRIHTYLDESLALCREIGYIDQMGNILYQLGRLAFSHGDTSARAWFEESLKIQDQIGKNSITMLGLAYLGHLAFQEGNYMQARTYYEDSLSISEKIWGVRIPFACIGLGYVFLRQGNQASARSLFIDAYKGLKEEGEKSSISYLLEGLASLAIAQRRFKQATQLIAWVDVTRAVTKYHRAPDRQVDIDHDIATIHAHLDDATFAAAQAAGRTMSMDEAITYALESTHPSVNSGHDD